MQRVGVDDVDGRAVAPPERCRVIPSCAAGHAVDGAGLARLERGESGTPMRYEARVEAEHRTLPRGERSRLQLVAADAIEEGHDVADAERGPGSHGGAPVPTQDVRVVSPLARLLESDLVHDLRLRRARWLRALASLRANGVAALRRRQALGISTEPPVPWRAYRAWLASAPPLPASGAALPRTSLLVPVFRPAPGMLEALHASLAAQGQRDLELCLATDGAQPEAVRRTIASLAALDSRVRVAPEAPRAGIAAATNRAASVATGELLALVDQDDLLPRDALAAVARAFATNPSLDLLYTDEDQLETWGLRDAPRFKPGPSPVLLLGVNYVLHLLVLRRPLFDALGGLRPGYDGAQDHDLALRAFERARTVGHLRRVAYTWRRSAASVAGGAAAKPWAYEAGRRAVEDAVLRRRLPVAAVRHTPVPGVLRLELAPRAQPLAVRVAFRDARDAARWEPALTAARELSLVAVHAGRAPAEAFAGDAALAVVAPDLAPDAAALLALARLAAFPGVGAVAAASRAANATVPRHLGFSIDRSGRASAVPVHGVAALCPREVATSCGGVALIGPAVATRARALAGAALGDADVACLLLAAHGAGASVLFAPSPALVSTSAAPCWLDLTTSALWRDVSAGLPAAFFEDGADRFCPRHPLLIAAGYPAPVA